MQSVNNKMSEMKRIFQFSHTDKSERGENEVKKLKEVIVRLGASFDDSNQYSESATHLIVGERIECTEKVLCFTAAGKHILRKSYIQDSFILKRWLDEKLYHISTRETYKLAKASLKWFNKIAESVENAPFYNWNVGCMVDGRAKSNSLIKIIKAGNGNAYNVLIESLDPTSNKPTLIIYGDERKEMAIQYSLQLGIPCYPYQCIPDYLTQAEKSNLPHYPVSYYTYLEKSLPILSARDSLSNHFSENCSLRSAEITFENVTLLDDSVFRGEFLINSTYNMYLLSSSQTNSGSGSGPYENCLEAQFFTLWTNGAYNEAINLIILLEHNVLPLENTLVLLFEFIINPTSRQKQSFSNDILAIYNNIYAFILKVLLNHPPVNETTIQYYRAIFDKLDVNSRIETGELNSKGMVDMVYLLSIHDFLLLSSRGVKDLNEANNSLRCLLRRLSYFKDLIFKKIIRQVNADKNATASTYHKLFQVICFSNRYVSKSKLFTQLETNIAGCLDLSNLTYQRAFIQLV